MKKLFLCVQILAAAILSAENLESPYGICAHVSRMPERKIAGKEFIVMKKGGIDWVRSDFDWKYIQKKPGEWDYSHLDKLLKTAKEQKMNILPILCYDVTWVVPVYKNLEAWREYVRRTVSRYAKELRYWEVWNEANLVNGPKYTRLNAEQYTLLLKAAYEEIKKIDPKLQVLYSGTGGVPIPFIEASLKAGAAQYFDIMNIHPYCEREVPEEAKEKIDPLFRLFAKYNVKKPVWATEFSWATHKAVSVAPVLSSALSVLKIDPQKVSVAVVRNLELETLRGKEFPENDFSLELFPNRKEIGYADLKNLDTAEYPLLIPSLTEAFPDKYFDDILAYVRKGGTLLLHSNGFPFYYDAVRDASGKWTRVQRNSAHLMKALHIDWLAGWCDNVPRKGKLRFASGISNAQIGLLNGERYLSAKNLKDGDRLIPILIQENGAFSAPVAGVYKFNSDLKGAVVMSVVINRGGVSEEIQGKFLPRAYLYFLSVGFEKIFWYKFLAEEQSPTGLGGHFGIVHRDFSPRDAFTAYRFLTRMHPAGSSRPVMKNNGNLYSASWKRPDGMNIHAYWTIRAPEQIDLPFTVRKAYDYLGRELSVSGRIIAKGEIIYLMQK